MLANKDILQPVVEQTLRLVHEDQFTNLVQELGFRKERFNEDKVEDTTPGKVIVLAQNRFFMDVKLPGEHKNNVWEHFKT